MYKMGLLPELLDLVGEQVQWDVEVALICHEVSTLFHRHNKRSDIVKKLCKDTELVEYCFEWACIEEAIPVLDWLYKFYFTECREIDYLYGILLQGGKEKTIRWLHLHKEEDWKENWFVGGNIGYDSNRTLLHFALCSRNAYLVNLQYTDTLENMLSVFQTNDVELVKSVIAHHNVYMPWWSIDMSPFPVSPEMYHYLETELHASQQCLRQLRLANLAYLNKN